MDLLIFAYKLIQKLWLIKFLLQTASLAVLASANALQALFPKVIITK